jgi:tetratricopeptide (TPR) repeat protein
MKKVTESPRKRALLAKKNRLSFSHQNRTLMNKILVLGSVCTPLIVSTPVYAQKSLAMPYLAQAKKPLPTIGIELDPGDGGEVASAGKWDEAEKLYTRAIALNPKEPTAYLDRGRVRGERKHFALAIDDATVALTLLGLARDSTLRAVSAAYASRASYWLGMGEPRRALVDALVATEADPDFSGARLGKADAYYALGELDEANLQLIQAQVLDFKIKRSYTASGAEKNARKNGRLDGKRDTDPLFQAATRAQQEGKLKEAIEGYTAVLALDPGIANAWWNRALAQIKTGNLAATLADSSTYVAIAGRNSDKTDHAKALRFRASVYTRLRRHWEAVSDLEWAVKLKPDEPKNAAQLKTARETLAAQPSGSPSPQER